jgi:NADH-quinone oxidoreductase subunit A
MQSLPEQNCNDPPLLPLGGACEILHVLLGPMAEGWRACGAEQRESERLPVDHLPVLIALGFALSLGGIILVAARFIGSRSGGKVKLSPYESGEPLLDTSRKRVSIVFFLIAIDFVIFDVEAAFLYPWALVLRAGGWPLFWAVMVFILLILVGFAYVWRRGGLDLLKGRRTAPAKAHPAHG